jgi:hypothetical protein
VLVRGDDLPTVTVANIESMVQKAVKVDLDRQQVVQNSLITGVIIGMILTMIFVAVLLWLVGA